MKKLLATLLVALMIMSCMAVVSFAALPVVSTTVTDYPYAAMSSFDTDTGEGFDPLCSKYVEAFKKITGKTPFQANKTAVFKACNSTEGYYNSGCEQGSMGVMPEYVTSDDLVIIPVSITSPGYNAVAVDAIYDSKYLTPVLQEDVLGMESGIPHDLATITGTVVYEITDAGTLKASSLKGNAAAGVHLYLIFKVNPASEANKGDEGLTTKTTQIDINVVEKPDYTIGNELVNVKIGGLLEGEAAEDDEPEYITSDDVAAITPVVMGKFGAADMVESINEFTTKAADLSEEDLVNFDAANMSYIPVFATYPTAGKEAPTEYGIILHAAEGTDAEDAKVAGKDAENGMFGVFFYGFTGHLEKYDSASLYVVVNGQTYTSALGNF